MDYKYLRDHLEKAGVVFASGLTQQEFTAIEREFSFFFPPDLKAFLSKGLPVSEQWVDWRMKNREEIWDKFNRPYEGICFDIERNGFWMSEWGNKPGSLPDCFRIARKYFDKAPKLIPIYSHRYIPDRPNEKDNPIFSVYQTDIICYGNNLEEYLGHEFPFEENGQQCRIEVSLKNIEFWSRLVELE